MPTYDYECGACKHSWDEFQSMSAKPTKKCPKCAKAKANRKIGAGGGVIFKGSGFYQTDYRSDSYKKGAEAETKSATPAKAEATSDSKPSSDKTTAPATPPAKSSAAAPAGEAKSEKKSKRKAG